ncbi:AAA family ATPase [Rhodoferax sp. AJA081-3]|uniref:KAP family P-loop NTPase fold protein n=1 Tax=Rhodoferax sp. AJA081-3 TaxID=2752316 RepID=UPI001ADFD859|nr:P-loop NTPase fold protein [Rhodoferax sp. AJA081-3]QTN28224.1 AAA family ATPase [Rhodoferax sp. AJA081-3]
MDFSTDNLGRQKFADLLIGYATRLATVPISPAGRVIAVDAPWGAGKSWIARRLPSHFEADNRIGTCVYVDAFQFDYHQDPFAVVTSAILEGFQKQPAAVRSLKNAAVKVLKVSLPAIGKGLMKAGGRAIGVDTDDFVGEIVDAGTDASDKAIEQMLDTFSKTSATTAAFKEKLSELANTSENCSPLVVIIDELDRCRPSYALELLERVKHLFDVKNVVFIFFVHTPALHSAVRKTYGQDINPSEYLKKFFAVTVGLPIAQKPDYKKSDQTDFLAAFLSAQYGEPEGGSRDREVHFRRSLCVFAPMFQASFRDLESVMLLWNISLPNINLDPQLAAYALLLKVKDPSKIAILKVKNPVAYRTEFERLGPVEQYEDGLIAFVRDIFLLAFDETAAKAKQGSEQKMSYYSIEDYKQGLRDLHRIFFNLDLEYIRL